MTRERPILFSGEMVRAILAGKKTQTRRLHKWGLPEPREFREVAGKLWPFHVRSDGSLVPSFCPYGVPGDRLWVRETWYDDFFREPGEANESNVDRFEDGSVEGIEYRATHDCRNWEAGCPCRDDNGRSCWRPSIHMPRWASRITLEVTEVRVQRLQDISEEDARAEGVQQGDGGAVYPSARAARRLTYRDGFRELWDSVYRKRAPCESNPWVWAVSFRRAQ